MFEAEESSSGTSQKLNPNFFTRMRDRYFPKSNRREKLADQVDWRENNVVQANYNRVDLENRKTELSKSGLIENYKGDLMGMQVLEGPVEIIDRRSGTEKLARIQVRVVSGRNIVLPQSISTQHSGYSDVNKSLFATLCFNGISEAMDNLIVVDSPEVAKGRYYETGNSAMIDLIEQYEKINQDSEVYPLTLIYAHGEVGQNGQHIIKSGDAEMYPTDLVLWKLIDQYPIAKGVDKIPVLLTSCNETEEKSAVISHPRMSIVYRDGLAGLLNATGVVRHSK